MDFQFDETSRRLPLKLCNIVDEYTSRGFRDRVDRTCTAENVIAVIEQLVTQRGTPEYLRADNGPEMSRGRCGTLTADWRVLRRRTLSPACRGENRFVESLFRRLF